MRLICNTELAVQIPELFFSVCAFHRPSFLDLDLTFLLWGAILNLDKLRSKGTNPARSRTPHLTEESSVLNTHTQKYNHTLEETQAFT